MHAEFDSSIDFVLVARNQLLIRDEGIIEFSFLNGDRATNPEYIS